MLPCSLDIKEIKNLRIRPRLNFPLKMVHWFMYSIFLDAWTEALFEVVIKQHIDSNLNAYSA